MSERSANRDKNLAIIVDALREALAAADAIDEFVLAARINDALVDACDQLACPPAV